MENTVKKIEVDTEKFIKAVEFYCSSAYSRPESWMYFEGVFCMDFFSIDERPSHRDYEGFNEWLRLCGDGEPLENNDENYTNWLQSVRDYIESIALNSFTTEEGQDIEVTYI